VILDQGTVRWLREDPLADHLLCLDRPDREEGRRARAAVLTSPGIRTLIDDVSADPWSAISNHRSVNHPLHKLAFLAEFGMSEKELGLTEVMDRIVGSIGEEGLPRLPISISPKYGGDGGDVVTWMLCDSPLLAYALVKLGRGGDPAVLSAVRTLTAMISDNGYRCVTSPLLAFRGPGRKDDPCPYADLLMLKLLSVTDTRSPEASVAADCILDLWENSRTKHPYMFFMGTDFRKMKYPLFWYDILHVTEVLSRFEALREDTRLIQMVEVIASQADRNGRYTPQSVWTAWKGWEFGQKKEPSRLLTLAAWKVLSRYDDIKI
jgi:hypothetical protein